MTRFKLAVGAGVVALVAASSASAECGAALLASNAVQISAVYEGFSTTDTRVPLLAPAAMDADCADKRIAYAFSSFDGRSLNPNGLELRNASGVLSAEIVDDAANIVGRGGRFEYTLNPASASASRRIMLSLPGGQRVASGLYEGQVRVTATVLDDKGVEQSRHEGLIAVSVRVAPSVSLSAAWGTDLDLGDLTPNGRARAPLKFRAYANTRYEIVLTSDRAFGLSRPNAGRSIPYTPVLSGIELASGSDRMASFDTPPLSLGFNDHTLDVVVPELGLRPAGEYEDFITVTIRPALS